MLSIAYPETEPKDPTPKPVTDAIAEIFHGMDISESLVQSEAQLAEQLELDKIFLSNEAGECTAEEMGRAEADALLAANESEEEEEVTAEERPVTVPDAPFSCIDIRTKSLAARTAALKKLSEKNIKRKYAPRRPPVYSTAFKRPSADYPPPVPAASKHTEGEAKPSKIRKLMSITIRSADITLPPYESAPTVYYAGNYSRPLTECRKRRYENVARQPLSGQYMPHHRVGEGWDGLWFCGNKTCGAGNLSKANRKCRKCATRYSLLRTPESPSYR